MPLLFVLLLAIGPPRLDKRQKPTADFSRLTIADAERQVGQWVRVTLELDSLPEPRDGSIVFDCESVDSVQRTVWFATAEVDPDAPPDGPVAVVGRLAIVEHAGNRIGATWFPPFTELRLLEARRVK